MQEYIIAERYAHALIDLVPEHAWDETITELSAMEMYMADITHLREFLTTPLIPVEHQNRVLNAILTHARFSDVSYKFFNILFRKGRLILLSPIREALQHCVDERRNRATAYIASAFEINAEEQAKIAHKVATLAQKKLSIDVRVDKTLLAGVTITIGHTIYDFSMKNKLMRLERRLTQHA